MNSSLVDQCLTKTASDQNGLQMKDGETACDGSNIGRLDLPLRPAIIRAKKLLLKHDRI